MNLNIIVTVLLGLSGMILLTEQLHMLQQNSYFNSRYLGWLRTSFGALAVWRIIFAAVVAILAVCRLFYIAIAAAAVLLAVSVLTQRSQQKRAIKPLVFTARVKRMYVTASVVFAVMCICSALISGVWPVIVQAVLCAVTPAVCIAVNIINAPIEATIRQHYINDAMRILRSYGDRLTVLGVTGSYGKTSTKYILSRILSEKYNVAITPGSFNTPMGVVRTIREHLRSSDELFIVEMGAKNVGDIDEICKIVHPTMGVISSVGPQHLSTFGSVENVLKTKFELADCVHAAGGDMFLCGDNQYICSRAADGDTLYGSGENCSYRAENVACSRYGTAFDAVLPGGRRLSLQTKLLGRHSVCNIMGAVAVADRLGVSHRDIVYAVSQLQAVEHRLQLKPFMNGASLIDDAYNSNPEGSLEAVRTMGTFDGCKKIIVTPGMVELGEREYECNRALGAMAAGVCDELIFVGEQRSVPLVDGAKEAGYDGEHIHVVPMFKDALDLLRSMTDADTVVLFENDLPDNYAK